MFDRSSTVAEVLESPRARAILEAAFPAAGPALTVPQFQQMRVGVLPAVFPDLDDPSVRDAFWADLAALDEGPEAVAPYPEAIEPDPAYESGSVARASARIDVPDVVQRWGRIELRIDGPSHGNPFVDVELDALFTRGDREVRVGGFYDGDGVYRIRALADEPGEWTFVTRSTARSLDGLQGRIEVAEGDARGPVRVDGLHFRYADGTRYRPVGTTAYAWTHQPDPLQDRTLETLATTAFTKMRMCVFPKSYLFNENEPADFPFVGSLESGFDWERFDPAHFARLERRIEQLGELGIEADLILFHAYDRWGFSAMGPAVDDRYLRYVVRRLAGYAHVWWSMANEYELLWSKEESDWERLAALVSAEDPFGHLTSIHNIRAFYDHGRPWVTHASIQRVDVYRTSENTDTWRCTWHKPVVIDEVAYEGDIDQGWGNITGEELVRRCWEGAVRGGYVGHGETYLNDRDELWWSKGGELVGSSPDRMRFLDELIAEAPGGVLDPLPGDWDVPRGGVAGEHVLLYFGFNQPRYRHVQLPEGEWAVDVVDTWGMTIEALEGTHTEAVRVVLPGRQYMAVRLRRVG
jgi:hypothetical protein